VLVRSPAALVRAAAGHAAAVRGGRGVRSGDCTAGRRRSVPVAEGTMTEENYISVSFLNCALAFSSWVLCSSRTWLEHLCGLGKVAV